MLFSFSLGRGSSTPDAMIVRNATNRVPGRSIRFPQDDQEFMWSTGKQLDQFREQLTALTDGKITSRKMIELKQELEDCDAVVVILSGAPDLTVKVLTFESVEESLLFWMNVRHVDDGIKRLSEDQETLKAAIESYAQESRRQTV